jgi:tRNA(fMet)-specific endonuclease VapC
MTLYMLDTNTVSYFVKGNERVEKAIFSRSYSELCISSITEAELLYGIAKRPQALRYEKAIVEFLSRVESLPFASAEARFFANARSDVERKGRPLDLMDMLIAAHALSVGAVLVTSDQVFGYVDGLQLENWAA